MLHFRDVPIVPFSELIGVHRPGLPWHRGGPIWPEFANQVEARHCRVGKPADNEPDAVVEGAPALEQPIAWAGPIVPHFGHQLADFSMRLLPTLLAWPEALIAFGTHPRRPYPSLQHTEPHFRELLAWFGVPEHRVRILSGPTIAPELFVAPQAEQISGPGPDADYLDKLDDLVARRLGIRERAGVVYVSRAGMSARFAGEVYLERALALAGVRIFRPERMSLLVQLRTYLSADQLIFAEGSALHGMQLLGRSIGHVTVLVRIRGWRVAEASLQPRTQSLRYADATAGLLHGLFPSGIPAVALGMPVLGEGAVLDEFERLAVPLREHWRSADFEAARDGDIRLWLDKELTRPSAPGSHDVLVATMAAAGIPWPAVTQSKGPMTSMEKSDADGGPASTDAVSARPIRSVPTDAAWSPRRLNRLAVPLGATTYLEIGVARGDTFRAVDVAGRTGVDPAFAFEVLDVADEATSLHEMTSDRFFQTLPPDKTFDLVFLDGLHSFEQTYRDLCNVLIHSHPRTVILVDDTKPSDVFSSFRDHHKALEYRSAAGDTDTSWHGDTFKLVFALHDFHPGLNYCTIVGSGNPQTLVWRSNKGWRDPLLDSMEAISRLSYFDLLESSRVLRECSEDDAIEQCVREVVPVSGGPKADLQSPRMSVDVIELATLDRDVLWGRTLERPRTSETGDGNNLLISGWAVGREARVERINVNSGATSLEWIPVNLDRPDVSTAFPDAVNAGSSGFRAALALPVGPFSLELEAVLANGTRHPIASIAGVVAP